MGFTAENRYLMKC